MLYCGSYPPVWNLCLRRLFVLCAQFLALLMCAHTHAPNASLDMDQLNFPKQNPKFKASNTIMRYYFVYRVNKFYYSPVFFCLFVAFNTQSTYTHSMHPHVWVAKILD